MIVENTESFQIWLSKILKPLCDADPAALAKYVLALIKKDKSEKELRQSMTDQLDVFLQGETKPFVNKLFEALKSKEYLNPKLPDPSPPRKSESASGDKGATESAKGEKPSASTTSETEPTSSTSGPTAAVNSQSSQSSSLVSTQPSSGQSSQEVSIKYEGKKVSNTLSISPSALLSSEATSSATSSQNDSIAPKEDLKSRRDNNRRDYFQDDRDKRRKRSRMERDRRVSRSRSGDRNKRSRSPRLRDRSDRLRHRPRKSPPIRRYERDVWDRRRCSRSPIRNRSASPRNRSRTPPRYRRPFNSSRSRSRSPMLRDRSRSPRSRSRSPLNSKDKKDSLLPLPLHTDSDMSSSPDKPMVASVVVRPGPPPQGDSSSQSQGSSGSSRCRDFDEKGLCMRGELCPFDHGQDPVVLEDVVVSGGNGPAYNRGMVPGAPGYNGPLARPGMIGEYYPDSPSLEQPVGWGPGAPPGFRPRHLGFDPVRGRGGMLLRPPGMGPYPGPGPGRQLISVPVMGVPPSVPVMGDMRGPHPPMPPMQMHPIRGLHAMRGRGRGGFDHGRLGAKPPRNYTNCSLEVRKIPREQNSIMDLNSHFLRFGKIINIQINFDNDPEAALVTFSSPTEAQLAYRSTEAVLNNRFIRVFLHNKEKENEEEAEHQGKQSGRIPVRERLGAQQEPEQHEKILISGNTITKTVYNNAALQAKKLETHQEKLQTVENIKRSQEMLAAQVSLRNMQEQKKQEALKMSNDLRKRQQTMMEEQIGQQKKLIAKLESGKLRVDEKEETLKLIRILQDNVTKLKKDLDESNPKLIRRPNAPVPQTKEEAQKEMLDAELDLYNQEQQGGDTNDLQMKVLELRARARSLGLIGTRGRGSFRGGRGFRGRGIIRGRGRGIVRALRSVDRRPTRIRVTGFPSERLQDLLVHFTMFGPIRDYFSDQNVPEIIFDFDSRKCAEVAMANGQTFEDIALTLEWVTENNSDNKAGQPDVSNDVDASNNDLDLDTSGSLLDDDDDELGDILNSEILLTGEEDEDDEEDRSWRR